MAKTYEKNLIIQLGFSPKEKASGIYLKKYKNGFIIEIDFENEIISYGKEIKCENKTTQNFSMSENFVVLECVNRLLEKGYNPKNIILEKTYPAGHGSSGRLDICINRDDGSEYMLIECKTFGKEFDKEFSKMKKNGGQLFTYFKFSNKPDVIMLYASELKGKEIVYHNEIIKIEEDYRTGDVKDFYEKWNKLTKDNGIFDDWVKPYNFESKALTIYDLVEIKQEDSSFIFNQFLEILRHNVVSDKPNAFNKIFTLFLCKIYDEKKNDETNNKLDFQWLEGIDNDVSFQLRLTDLYKEGMFEFLEKKVTDISENEFDTKFQQLFTSNDSLAKELKEEIIRIRLEKNNEFAIKEVYDKKSFTENAKVVKEVVELLQKYKIRYAKKQQYLSDFFELLLTTGLKQESGQFFTPVPVAQFIIKSLPIDNFVKDKLKIARKDDMLPHIIDYAAGSGHFITECMHELQTLLSKYKTEEFTGETKKFVKKVQDNPYEWAFDYVYGIEKDYRLVKVGKVGCYLHGDGLANVIHSDGLANFDYREYKGLLSKKNKDFKKENNQFDILVSNPPYSVSAFKNASREYYTEEDYDLYKYLTDNSSEIECLFVERMKQLLKNGGVAGIILPSSILSNEGIYTKAREIILQYFEIIAITELGSNTFMATGTNTVVLFLRRRDNYDYSNLQIFVDRFFTDFKDVNPTKPFNTMEKPVTKYIKHVWENISFDDYVSLLKKAPNKKITNHEIYKEYKKNIKTKTEKDFWNVLLETEKEKLLHFILAYLQKVVLIKTGEKDAEKRFLGYEFSNRRGSEGIHPIQRGKIISECTRLFDEEVFDNPEKASTYIYKAFNGDYDFPIHKSLIDNISLVDLIDMLTFDRAIFGKNISTAVKKKVKIDSKYPLTSIENITCLIESGSRPEGGVSNIIDGIYSLGGEHIHNNNGYLNLNSPRFVPVNFYENAIKGKLQKYDLLLCKDGALTGKVAIVRNELDNIKAMINEHLFIIRCQSIETQKYLFHYLLGEKGQIILKNNITGAAQGGLNSTNLKKIKIPLPPKEIQQKIVAEIEKLENNEIETKENIIKQKDIIKKLINATFSQYQSRLLGDLCDSVEYGTSAKSQKAGDVPVIRMGNIQDGKIDWGDLVYTSDPDEISKYSLKKNDVLFNRTNSPELVGKVGIYKGERPAVFAGYLIRVNYKEDILNPIFLAYVLNSETIRNHGFSVMSKSVNQANINGTLLKAYRIPVPPLSEQQKIVSKIEKIEAQIQDMQNKLEQLSIQKELVLKKYL